MVTAQLFIETLQSPSEPLRKLLDDPRPECRYEGGKPCILRLTDFFEADVRCRGRLFRIAAPLREEVSRRAVYLAGRLHESPSLRISGFRLAKDAMAWLDERGELRTEHLFAEQLPEGRPLNEVLDMGYPAELLHSELTAMQQEFVRLGFSHGNLKPENLLLTPKNRLIATRCYRARFEGPSPEDEQAFQALHKLADLRGDGDRFDGIGTETEGADNFPDDWAGPFSEGLRPIIRQGLYGFADTAGRAVIRPRFLAAEPFYEGRAVVQTKSGYGVIDKTGEIIVSPYYDDILYDRKRSLFHVRLRDRWCTLNYTGKPLTAFGPVPPDPVGEEA